MEKEKLMKLTKNIFRIIFLYLDDISLNSVFELAEFSFIQDDNYFWNLKILYDFPKYFIPEVSGYNWKEVYQGLKYLSNPDTQSFELETDRETFIKYPNLFELYLEFDKNILSQLFIIRRGIKKNISVILSQIVTSLIYNLIKKYPETFRYLVQYDLIQSENPNLKENMINWILHFGDISLLDKIKLEYSDPFELFKILSESNSPLNIIDYYVKV